MYVMPAITSACIENLRFLIGVKKKMPILNYFKKMSKGIWKPDLALEFLTKVLKISKFVFLKKKLKVKR